MMKREGGADAVVPDEVLELLEERSRIQGWLDRLLELREEATPAVYEKVRADYEQRLQSVSGRLAEHRSDLESSVARHRSRVESLQGERDEAAIRLEEAELRYRVGEYEEEEWNRHRDKGEAETRELEQRLGDEKEALATLENVLAELVTGGRAAAEEGAAGQEAGTPGEEAGPEEMVEAGARGSTAEVGPAAGAPAALGVEDVEEGDASAASAAETVGTGSEGAVEEASGHTEKARRAPAPAPETGEERTAQPAAEEGDVSDDYLDELEFLESLSLDETDRFDAVSAMLDEEATDEAGEGSQQEEGRST